MLKKQLTLLRNHYIVISLFNDLIIQGYNDMLHAVKKINVKPRTRSNNVIRCFPEYEHHAKKQWIISQYLYETMTPKMGWTWFNIALISVIFNAILVLTYV